jgi:NAD(P)-dependent dehydrogenase (short-subunit alcohol dehydrogenase family)
MALEPNPAGCTVMRPTILITGATHGLGRGVAERLAADGATLLLHGRDAGRLTTAATEIRDATGNDRITTHRADLASLDEVRALADDVSRTTDELHVLVSNAGIGTAGARQLSDDGHELRLAVNYLAGFVLTLRLLPLLRASAPARIVNVASLGQAPLDFDDVMLTKGYDGTRAYSQSKLSQIMFTIDLAEELKGTGVTVNSLHPATYMNTTMVRAGGITPMSTVKQGGEAILHLISGDDVAGKSGLFFNGMNEMKANPQAYDADARRRLRELSLRLTGLPAA